jgi:hypothetical protein
MSKKDNSTTPAVETKESFDLVALPKETLIKVLDSLLQQGEDSSFVQVHNLAYGGTMEDSARAMHGRKYELNITRKGKK